MWQFKEPSSFEKFDSITAECYIALSFQRYFFVPLPIEQCIPPAMQFNVDLITTDALYLEKLDLCLQYLLSVIILYRH